MVPAALILLPAVITPLKLPRTEYTLDHLWALVPLVTTPVPPEYIPLFVMMKSALLGSVTLLFITKANKAFAGVVI